MTINTDFGETEADARQTNLTRFDVLFPEKRAFFLEGADIFEFGSGLDVDGATVIPFFSRTIGLYTPEGEDEGTVVPLRGGGKLQGRIGNTNVGALAVATDRVKSFGVPKTEMGAVRIRQNVLLGVIGTFGDPLNRTRSWLGGADFTYRTSQFQEDKNLVAGIWGLATDRRKSRGDRGAYGGNIAYPNDELDAGMTFFHVGRDFKPSLGFVQRAGQVFDASADYTVRPGAPVRQVKFGGGYFEVRNPNGRWESYALSAKPLDLTFESGDRLQLEFSPEGERLKESFDIFDSPAKTVEIRAGQYDWKRWTSRGTLAPARQISGEIAYSIGGFYGGHLRTVEASVILKPLSILTLQLTSERNMATLEPTGFTQFLHGLHAELKLSPEFQVTHFLQYDNESRSLGSASRLRWTFHPLGDLFVAYNHNMTRSVQQTRKRWEFASDQLLMKVQYSLRW
ncbi:MAG: hypothetical protein E6K78_05950 [Candidatus Eisenbacteria bacterium]|uniref:DUF5916 domain-containing protein n=1 Tax=Eiseniibacteriota bacterium TaxID=2212470 RepID=A0A538TTB5_UNCEI|nr:MAG: hypothetical protein E6K78_05950 [Candidatus Eisenbacteria bacterium]